MMMGSDIDINVFCDDNGYPESIFIWDDGRIASINRPARVTILELERFYDKITPLIKSYRKWVEEKDAYSRDGRNIKPKTKVST
jgi:hypothetical protein